MFFTKMHKGIARSSLLLYTLILSIGIIFCTLKKMVKTGKCWTELWFYTSTTLRHLIWLVWSALLWICLLHYKLHAHMHGRNL